MGSDTPAQDNAPVRPIFEARLTPHRSLSRTGSRILFAVLVAGALVQAVPMVIFGAWPVGWFFGLDLVLIYICFRINFARAQCAEEVILSREELTLRRLGWRGDRQERRFNPFWVRLKTIEDEDFGVQRVLIVQRAEEVEVGSFLAPFEKADFARAFGGALAKARA